MQISASRIECSPWRAPFSWAGGLLPGCQLSRIQTLLTAPAAPRRLIHPSCGDQRLQSSRRRPALAASSPSARSIGERVRTPTLQRRCTHSNLARHLLHRRTLRRQQSRHDSILVRLSISSHFLMSAPSKGPILSGRRLLWGSCSRGRSGVSLAPTPACSCRISTIRTATPKSWPCWTRRWRWRRAMRRRNRWRRLTPSRSRRGAISCHARPRAAGTDKASASRAAVSFKEVVARIL